MSRWKRRKDINHREGQPSHKNDIMFIVAFENGWSRAINENSIKSVSVGQDQDEEWGFYIDTDMGRYQIDEDELEILVGKRIATILKRDLEVLK